MMVCKGCRAAVGDSVELVSALVTVGDVVVAVVVAMEGARLWRLAVIDIRDLSSGYTTVVISNTTMVTSNITTSAPLRKTT